DFTPPSGLTQQRLGGTLPERAGGRRALRLPKREARLAVSHLQILSPRPIFCRGFAGFFSRAAAFVLRYRRSVAQQTLRFRSTIRVRVPSESPDENSQQSLPYRSSMRSAPSWLTVATGVLEKRITVCTDRS